MLLPTTLARISDGVVLLNRDLSVIESSPVRRSMLGYPPDYWVGADPLRVVHPDDRAEGVRVLSSLLRSPVGTEERGETRLRRVDGTYVTVEIGGVNLLDDPDVGALVLTFRSVEDRIEAERVAAERQLELETALRQRVGFIEEASHALRNPLHGMLGLSELLTKADLEPRFANAATVAQGEKLYDRTCINCHGGGAAGGGPSRGRAAGGGAVGKICGAGDPAKRAGDGFRAAAVA